MRVSPSFLLLSLSFLFTFNLSYAQISNGKHIGRVVKVVDGDTFDVNEKDSIIRIRLFGIDAPEKGQEFYEESKQMLLSLTGNKQVIFISKGKDMYGRTIGEIIRLADGVNINYEMVRQGLAWHFVRYSSDPELAKLELLARQKQLGIWSLYHYTEPWEFRKH